MKSDNNYISIDEYLENFPENIKTVLEKIRKVIKKAAPEAMEVMSYRMPAFRQNGILVYFAAFKNHIGFYPTSSAISEFKGELSAYETTKGAVRFYFDKPVPYGLIRKIVKFRLKENIDKKKRKNI